MQTLPLFSFILLRNDGETRSDVSVDPVDGTIFVADGYGNSRVVAFDSAGVFLRMFGVGTRSELPLLVLWWAPILTGRL